jgi:hypothetical protein
MGMSALDDLLKWVREPVDDKTQAERIAICKQCEKYSSAIHMCNECKCLVDLKTRLARQRCPLNKWMDVK